MVTDSSGSAPVRGEGRGAQVRPGGSIGAVRAANPEQVTGRGSKQKWWLGRQVRGGLSWQKGWRVACETPAEHSLPWAGAGGAVLVRTRCTQRFWARREHAAGPAAAEAGTVLGAQQRSSRVLLSPASLLLP